MENMGRGAEEECVNGMGHGISEKGGGKKRWRTGVDHFGEYGERPEEEDLNGRGRIFRGSGGGEMLCWRTGADHFI